MRHLLLNSCALALLSFAGTGCSLLGSGDTAIEATGRVALAETGAPVVGLSVSLVRGGYLVAATTRTGSDGAFRLVYDPGEGLRAPLQLTINDEPYDGRYTVERTSLVRGEKRDLGTVELSLNPTP